MSLPIRVDSVLLGPNTFRKFLGFGMLCSNRNGKNLLELIRIRRDPQTLNFFTPEFCKGIKSPIIQREAQNSVNVYLLSEKNKAELCVDEFIHQAFRCVFAIEWLKIIYLQLLDDLNLVDEDAASKIKKCYLQMEMPSSPTSNDDFLKDFGQYMHHIVSILQQIFQNMNLTYLEKIANESSERARTVEIVLFEIEELMLEAFYHGNKATAFYYGTEATSFNREMKKKYRVQ